MSEEYYKVAKAINRNNSPYVKGRNFEYRCMARLRKAGFYVVRKFGSKGHEDLVAVRGAEVLFVQCKWSKRHDTKPKQYDLDGLIELAIKYRILAVFAGVRNHRMYFQWWNSCNDTWEDLKLE